MRYKVFLFFPNLRLLKYIHTFVYNYYGLKYIYYLLITCSDNLLSLSYLYLLIYTYLAYLQLLSLSVLFTNKRKRSRRSIQVHTICKRKCSPGFSQVLNRPPSSFHQIFTISDFLLRRFIPSSVPILHVFPLCFFPSTTLP